MEKAVLISENEFTKIFELDDIRVVFSKAYDEDSKLHFIVSSIPEIKELGVMHIQFPFTFKTEKQRDKGFKKMDELFALAYINNAKRFIISNQEKAKQEEAKKQQSQELKN